MSLILDALRKIEQERKAKQPGGIDLRPEVLSYRGMPQKTTALKRIFLVGGALLLIIGLGAAVFLRSAKKTVVARVAPAEEGRLAAPETNRAAVAEMPPLAPPRLQPPPAESKAEKALPAAPSRATMLSQDAATAGGADNIIVSGIAWQDERVLRRAVINGLLLAEGAEVLGARILEIKENRVRFSRNNQVFEVLYPSAAGK